MALHAIRCAKVGALTNRLQVLVFCKPRHLCFILIQDVTNFAVLLYVATEGLPPAGVARDLPLAVEFEFKDAEFLPPGIPGHPYGSIPFARLIEDFTG